MEAAKTSGTQAYRLNRLQLAAKNSRLEKTKIEHYYENGILYVKAFLIDDTRNNNGWRASWNSIKKNIRTFIGRPGIEYTACTVHGCDLDHTDGDTKEESEHIQEPYRQTTIVDTVLDEFTHTAYAIHRVETKDFAEKIQKGEILYLSPSIWPNREKTTMSLTEHDEWYIDTTDWEGLHSAWVNRPAYNQKARIVGQCIGDESCIPELRDNRAFVGRDASFVYYYFKALKAAEKDDKVKGPDGKLGNWVTSNGAKFFIEDGKNQEDEIKRQIAERKGTEGSKVDNSLVDSIQKHNIEFYDSGGSGLFYISDGDTYKFYQENQEWVKKNFKWNGSKKTWMAKSQDIASSPENKAVIAEIKKRAEDAITKVHEASPKEILGDNYDITIRMAKNDISAELHNSDKPLDEIAKNTAEKMYKKLRYSGEESIVKSKIAEALAESYADLAAEKRGTAVKKIKDSYSAEEEEEAAENGISVKELRGRKLRDEMNLAHSETFGMGNLEGATSPREEKEQASALMLELLNLAFPDKALKASLSATEKVRISTLLYKVKVLTASTNAKKIILNQLTASQKVKLATILYKYKSLTAKKFKPNPGEKPDKDGRYWRTINNQKRWFELDEEMQPKIDSTVTEGANFKKPDGISQKAWDSYGPGIQKRLADGDEKPAEKEEPAEPEKPAEKSKTEKPKKDKAPIGKIDDKTGFRLLKGQKIQIKSTNKDYVGAMKKAWNDMDDSKKIYIKKILVTETPRSFGGRFKPYVGSITMQWPRNYNGENYKKQSKELSKEISGILEHEIAHSHFDSWPIEVMHDFIEATKDIGPITTYSQKYKGRLADKHHRVATEIRDIIDSTIEEVESGTDFKDTEKYRYMSRIWKYADVKTTADVKSGKLKKYADKEFLAGTHIYENENHSEFMTIYKGHKTQFSQNKANYAKYKKVYEKLKSDGRIP